MSRTRYSTLASRLSHSGIMRWKSGMSSYPISASATMYGTSAVGVDWDPSTTRTREETAHSTSRRRRQRVAAAQEMGMMEDDGVEEAVQDLGSP